MAPLNSLPTDQRLVLHLLLVEHRSYAEIADLLSTTRAAVRARAFAAFDSAEPRSDIAFERRALIVDYLTGQLPQPVADEIGDHLSQSASEQAWVAAVRSELGLALIRAIPSNPDAAPTTHVPDRQTPPKPVSAPGAPTQLTPPTEKVPNASARQHRPQTTRALLAASTAATSLIIAVIIVIASTGTSHKPATSPPPPRLPQPPRTPPVQQPARLPHRPEKPRFTCWLASHSLRPRPEARSLASLRHSSRVPRKDSSSAPKTCHRTQNIPQTHTPSGYTTHQPTRTYWAS
jgi:hypothetical protein